MPELPEVESLARYLAGEVAGRTVARVDLVTIAALKTFDPPLDALVGRAVNGAGRRGKWLLVGVDDLCLAVHLARGGWVRWRPEAEAAGPRPKPGKGGLALRVGFDGGGVLEVTEAGTEKRLALHLVRRPEEVAQIAELGVDPLDPAFDVARLAAIMSATKAQVKKVLTDQEAIAGVGNAYSDEALHAARLSPFKPAANLTPAEVERLHAAVTAVLGDAVARSAELPAAGLKKEKKLGLRIHGRAGEACPDCGDTIREVSFATSSLQYCPSCQTGGKPLADRRLSRLLK